jgi:signal transduction histidine kinase
MMQRALQFRKRTIEVCALVILLLFLGVTAGVRSVVQTREMNKWVSHTQEVLAETARVRLYRSRMHNQLWLYRATERSDLPGRYEADRAILVKSIASLGRLTADNQGQHDLIKNISVSIQEQITLLDQAMNEAQTAAQNGRSQNMTTIFPTDVKLPALLDKFESTEHELLKERTSAVEKNARWSLLFIISTGILSVTSLLLSAYHVQREILERARIESGLLRARELMGTQLDQQKTELEHAVEDLHTQIVARKKADEELRQLNAILEERIAERTKELEEKNRELESFNYSVSHDLRAPLRHMDGFSKILEEEYREQLPEEAKQHLNRIRLAASRMSMLVDDLLALSRLGRQPVKCKRVSLDEMLEDVKSAYAEEEKSREIIWKTSPMPAVEADPGLLRQVLTNLISNALKFTRQKSPAIIEVGCREEGNRVTVFVKDNGAGFDPKFADKLFGVFQRLHRQDEFEGTGIGLAIVARIIQKHGGRVWAESAPDRGATFYFTLAMSRSKKVTVEQPIGASA